MSSAEPPSDEFPIPPSSTLNDGPGPQFNSPLIPPHDPYAVLRIRDARAFLMGNLCSLLGTQMMSVVVGWEIYQRTNAASALGLVGLAQAIPIICLAMFAGQLADAVNRKRIVMFTQVVLAGLSLAMAAVSFTHPPLLPHDSQMAAAVPQAGLAAQGFINWANQHLGMMDHWLSSLFHVSSKAHFDDPAVPLMYVLLFGIGIARAFNDPAKSTILPRLVPLSLMPNAAIWASSSFQIAAVVGPAIGGFLAVVSFSLVYLIDALGHGALMAFLIPVKNPPVVKTGEKLSLKTLMGGLHFVLKTKVILATITMDLFAVLLGGAVALLPVYADMLKVGPIGLGFMRAAPSVGALLMGLWLAHRPPMKHAGKNLIWAVIGFGVATVIFGLTVQLPAALAPSLGLAIAMAMLFLTGAFDNISVVVRHTLVQVLTPDAMRGRVSAVNYIFIGTSNEIGAFESGISAAVFGPVISVVGGGIGTVVVVVACALIWPQLGAIRRLDTMGAEADALSEH